MWNKLIFCDYSVARWKESGTFSVTTVSISVLQQNYFNVFGESSCVKVVHIYQIVHHAGGTFRKECLLAQMYVSTASPNTTLKKHRVNDTSLYL